jgi:hypothetical protein
MRIRAQLVGSLAALLLLTACGAEERSDDPYYPEIQQAKSKATTDFEREVLEDSVISRAEYEEAVNRFINCVKDKGLTISTQDQSGYYVYKSDQAPNLDEVQNACSRGTKTLIEPLYVERLRNPGKIDSNEIFASCLVKHGLVEGGYTAADAKRDMENSFAGAPFDQEDPRLVQCLANPSL